MLKNAAPSPYSRQRGRKAAAIITLSPVGELRLDDNGHGPPALTRRMRDHGVGPIVAPRVAAFRPWVDVEQVREEAAVATANVLDVERGYWTHHVHLRSHPIGRTL
jgi:hypothetical protein